jgi:hypothetical protein
VAEVPSGLTPHSGVGGGWELTTWQRRNTRSSLRLEVINLNIIRYQFHRNTGMRVKLDDTYCGVKYNKKISFIDRLFGLVVGDPDYRSRGPGSILCVIRFSEK